MLVTRHMLGQLIQALLACLWLTQCAHRESAVKSPPPKVEWYIASKDPLTYCPKGQHVPQSGSWDAFGAEYVYLSDRSTRFYIPPKYPDHRHQALELRKVSLSESQKLSSGTEATMAWVGKTMLRLSLSTALLVVAGGGVNVDESVLQDIWSE